MYHLLNQSQSVIVVKLTVNSQDYKISLLWEMGRSVKTQELPINKY